MSSIIRTEQTKHMKNNVITVAEVFREVLKAAVTLEVITVFREVKAAADIIY
jgi:hypothetical protein